MVKTILLTYSACQISFFNLHFFRFKDLEVQEKVLLTRHMVQDRWCDVKVPESQELKNAKANASCKFL